MWANVAAIAKNNNGLLQFNLVGNYFKSGPETGSSYPCQLDGTAHVDGIEAYLSGNIAPGFRDNDTQAEDLIVHPSVGREYVVAERHDAAPVTTTSAATAYDDVLSGAGATLPTLDDADLRILADVANGTGGLIDAPADVGGWPTLTGGTAPTDTDADGIPDTWETDHGLNPNSAADGASASPSGYTWLEVYIHELSSSLPTAK